MPANFRTRCFPGLWHFPGPYGVAADRVRVAAHEQHHHVPARQVQDRVRAEHSLPVRVDGAGVLPVLPLHLDVDPSPATHAIWTRLKAGDLIDRVKNTLLDTT